MSDWCHTELFYPDFHVLKLSYLFYFKDHLCSLCSKIVWKIKHHFFYFSDVHFNLGTNNDKLVFLFHNIIMFPGSTHYISSQYLFLLFYSFSKFIYLFWFFFWGGDTLYRSLTLKVESLTNINLYRLHMYVFRVMMSIIQTLSNERSHQFSSRMLCNVCAKYLICFL